MVVQMMGIDYGEGEHVLYIVAGFLEGNDFYPGIKGKFAF
jgi:hypothetical protein